MSLILHLETATNVCSVALAERGQLLAEFTAENEYRHAARLGPLIQELLQDQQRDMSELSAVAVSGGPGSYTALRVGTATAKGLCYALGIPMIACATLQSLAFASQIADDSPQADTRYVALIDARRMEAYRQTFDQNGRAIEEPSAYIMDRDSFSNWLEQDIPLVFSGDGAAKLQDILDHPLARFSTVTKPRASYLVTLAWGAWQRQNFVDTAYYEPFYLKSPNITKAKPRL